MNANLKESPLTAADMVAHCRQQRTGVPAGDIRDVATLRAVLTLVLEGHCRRLQDPPPYSGALPTDPRQDRTACALATLIGRLEDLEHEKKVRRLGA
jgi:hypothetical protein